MPEITDAQLVKVLRPFVHGTRPVLDALRESDPFGLRRRSVELEGAGPDGAGPDSAGPDDAERPDDVERSVLANAKEHVLGWVSNVHVPGTPAWARMDAAERSVWWIDRVGHFTALLAAVPGLGGALADRLPVQDALGAAGQGLLLAAIAGEHGIRDDDGQIRLLARVLFERDVSAALRAADPAELSEAAAAGAELTAPITESKRSRGRATLRAVAGTMWRMGRMLWGLGDELGRRPQGRWYHKALGMLPVVGMAGDYLGERSALRRVAKGAREWIAQNDTAAAD